MSTPLTLEIKFGVESYDDIAPALVFEAEAGTAIEDFENTLASSQYLFIVSPSTVTGANFTAGDIIAAQSFTSGNVGASLDTSSWGATFSTEIGFVATGPGGNAYTFELVAGAARALVIDHTAKTVVYTFVHGVTLRTDLEADVNASGVLSASVSFGAVAIVNADQTPSPQPFTGGATGSGGALAIAQE